MKQKDALEDSKESLCNFERERERENKNNATTLNSAINSSSVHELFITK